MQIFSLIAEGDVVGYRIYTGDAGVRFDIQADVIQNMGVRFNRKPFPVQLEYVEGDDTYLSLDEIRSGEYVRDISDDRNAIATFLGVGADYIDPMAIALFLESAIGVRVMGTIVAYPQDNTTAIVYTKYPNSRETTPSRVSFNPNAPTVNKWIVHDRSGAIVPAENVYTIILRRSATNGDFKIHKSQFISGNIRLLDTHLNAVDVNRLASLSEPYRYTVVASNVSRNY